MSLTYQNILQAGGLEELAEVYHDPTNSNILLARVGFPRGRTPPFSDPTAFWGNVCELIRSGVFIGGFEDLFRAAAESYPGNPIFLQLSTNGREPPSEPSQVPDQDAATTGIINITGWPDMRQLLGTTQQIVNELSLPEASVRLGFANTEGVFLRLQGLSDEQMAELNARLESHEQTRGISLSTGEFQDYLISQLFVEGPDEARFEINDVRASTPLRDIAQGVISEAYDPKVFGQDSKGRERHVVIDRMHEDGSNERLDPDQSLHDNGIQEADTLSMSPESTAGAVHPSIREEALTRVRGQVLRYAQSHSNFKVSANAQQAPTEYLFVFNAPSFGPPPQPGAEPTKIDDHEVFLVLSANFPMQAPEVFWQTPIFHPNVDPKYGKVCLGELGDHYQPGLDFGELCQLLVDIAGYQNHVVHEGYNLAAQKWAVSPAGQLAIEQRGGRSTIRKILVERYSQPRSISVRRLVE